MTDRNLMFTPQQLVKRWGEIVTVQTLASWRSKSNGPHYVKIGGRIVYKLEDIEAWKAKRTVSGTGEYRP